MQTQTQKTYAFAETVTPRSAGHARKVPPRPFHQSIALFAAALKREDAARMMAGLVPALADTAQQRVSSLSELSSPERQARVAAHFGTRWDASTRLRRVMAESGPELQDEIFKLLPLYHRTLFPTYRPALKRTAVPLPAPALQAFAQRLVREAVS